MPSTSLLPLLDRAYDLDAQDSAWLQGLAEASLRAFPHADGVAAYTYDFSEAPRVTALAGQDEVVRIPALVHAELPFAAVRKAYGGRPRAMPVSWTWASTQGPVLPEPFTRAFGELGLVDGYAVLVPDGACGLAIGIGMPKSRYAAAPRASLEPLNQRWSAFALHARSALRLRAALSTGDIVGEIDAHCAGELAPELEAERAQLAARVRGIETARDDATRGSTEAVTLWSKLLEGRWSIVRHRRYGNHWRYLVIENPRHDMLRRLSALERRVAEHAVSGQALKLLALELDLHESSIANALRRALGKLGVTHRAHLTHLAAALVA